MNFEFTDRTGATRTSKAIDLLREFGIKNKRKRAKNAPKQSKMGINGVIFHVDADMEWPCGMLGVISLERGYFCSILNSSGSC